MISGLLFCGKAKNAGRHIQALISMYGKDAKVERVLEDLRACKRRPSSFYVQLKKQEVR